MSELITIIGAQSLLAHSLIEDISKRGEKVHALDFCDEPHWFESYISKGCKWFKAIPYQYVDFEMAFQNSTTIIIIAHQTNSLENIFDEDEKNQFFYHINLITQCCIKIKSIQKIIYVGSMIDKNVSHSSPLYYRHEVESILKNSLKPVITVKTSLIILPQSFPYKDILILLKKLPFIFFPTWIEKQVQPLYWKDLAEILIQLHLDKAYTKITRNINLPGPELISYRRLLEIILRKMKSRKKIHLFSFFSHKLWYLYLSFCSGLSKKRVNSLVNSWNQDAVNLLSDWKQKKSWWNIEDAVKDSMNEDQKKLSSYQSENYIKKVQNQFVYKTSSVMQLRPKEVSLEFFYWLQNFLLNLVRVEVRDDWVKIYFSQKLILIQEFKMIFQDELSIVFECYFAKSSKSDVNKCMFSINLCQIKNSRQALFSFYSNTKINFIQKLIIKYLMKRFNKYLEW